jgi:hypothetical protein
VVVPAVDDSSWPIVEITFPELVTLDDITIFEGLIERVFIRRGPMVTVADISALDLPSTTALHRKKIADAADDLGRRGALIGEAVVIRNHSVRLLYQGYLWARSNAGHPVQAFDAADKARDWARRLLKAQEISSRS